MRCTLDDLCGRRDGHPEECGFWRDPAWLVTEYKMRFPAEVMRKSEEDDLVRERLDDAAARVLRAGWFRWPNQDLEVIVRRLAREEVASALVEE